MILVECSWQDKKVVHSLPPDVLELIGHAVRVLLDNNHKICFSLNCKWSWPSNSRVPMHFIDPTSKSYNLVLMVCRSRHAMNYVPSVLTNLAATKSDEFL